MKKQLTTGLFSLFCFLVSIIATATHAAPFLIMTPEGTLPTSVPVDDVVTAKYKVYNNTPYDAPQIGLIYQGHNPTPNWIIQDTSDPASCQSVFTLPPYGNCTLVLTVSGIILTEDGLTSATGGPKLCSTKDNPTLCALPDPNYLLNIHTYTPSAPVVTGVLPPGGLPSGGTLVTISGENFYGVTSVMFGNAPAQEFQEVNSTTLTAISPAGSGTVDVTVVTPEGTSEISLYDTFTYEGIPTVTQVNPNVGSTGGGLPGNRVTITGTNFITTSHVSFGTTTLHCKLPVCVVDSSTQLTVGYPPASSTGTVDVTVTNSVGTSAITSADEFTYQGTPSVTGVSPASGVSSGGTPVTISGANFLDAESINFGTTVFTSGFTVSTDGSTITGISSPAQGGMPSTVDITVTTPEGTSAKTAADQFTYQSGINPNLVAVGTYTNGNPPLVMLSTDSGSTWSYVDYSSLPPDFYNPQINSISCNGTDCTAVGFYSGGAGVSTNELPLILNSKDGGQTWTGVNPANIILPSDAYQPYTASLYAVSCTSATVCTAVGSYNNGNSSGSNDVALILSFDSTSSSWIGIEQNAISYPSDSSGTAYLFSIDCSGGTGSTCTAAGYYFNTSSYGTGPLFLNSGTNNNWTSSNVDLKAITNLMYSPVVNSIDCNGASGSNAVCVAVGSYEDNSNPSQPQPLILYYLQESSTWTSLANTSITNPQDYSYLNVVNTSPAVACNGSGNSTICNIAASYYNTSSAVVPYILRSTAPSSSWGVPEIPGVSDAYLDSIDCESNNYCLAGGIDTSNLPIFWTSTDDGATWTAISGISYPTDWDSSGYIYLNAVECISTACIAGGFYTNIDYGFKTPLGLITSDAGTNWMYSNSFTQPSDIILSEDLTISSVSCSGDTCAAVGSYNNSSNDFALLYYSTDGGDNWLLPSTINLPSDLISSYPYPLSSVTCYDNTTANAVYCTAVGYYYSSTPNGGSGGNVPLVLNSLDGGVTWSSPSNLPLPSSYTALASLSGVTCETDGQRCVAVGSVGQRLSAEPVIYYTSDPTQNWILASSIGMPTNSTLNLIKGLTCNALACTTVGALSQGKTDSPLILNSSDGGNTWTAVTTLPSSQGVLTGVSCNPTGGSGSCIAVGSIQRGGTYPLIWLSATSTDPTSWTQVDSSSITLPTDTVTIGYAPQLSAIACGLSNEGCTATGTYANAYTNIPLILNSTNYGSSWSSPPTGNVVLPADFARNAVLYGDAESGS